MATLLNVRGMRFLQDFIGNAIPEDIPYSLLDQHQYQFSEALFETALPNYNECARMLRPLLIHMSNTAHLATLPYFDKDGNYELSSNL